MSRTWGALRRRVLTPKLSAASLDKRGFFVKSPEARSLLESVGRTFLTGFGFAAESSTPAAAVPHLEAVDRVFRGFAYEGAAMGFAIRDALKIAGARYIDSFLAGSAGGHVYMAHVGIGWAMARLPRWRWSRVSPSDPLYGWLAMDGFGFHQAYFYTQRYVYDQHYDNAFRWPSSDVGHYANRAVDQGIGRAVWFVEGTDGDRVATRIEKFAPHRHSDLWSGVGLAATYAGGATEAELRAIWNRAGIHRAVVAQGSAFASKARVRAGLMTSHTRLASEVFCGSTPESAAAVTDAAIVDLPADQEVPSYEIWRRRIAEEFASLGRY